MDRGGMPGSGSRSNHGHDETNQQQHRIRLYETAGRQGAEEAQEWDPVITEEEEEELRRRVILEEDEEDTNQLQQLLGGKPSLWVAHSIDGFV